MRVKWNIARLGVIGMIAVGGCTAQMDDESDLISKAAGLPVTELSDRHLNASSSELTDRQRMAFDVAATRARTYSTLLYNYVCPVLLQQRHGPYLRGIPVNAYGPRLASFYFLPNTQTEHLNQDIDPTHAELWSALDSSVGEVWRSFSSTELTAPDSRSYPAWVLTFVLSREEVPKRFGKLKTNASPVAFAVEVVLPHPTGVSVQVPGKGVQKAVPVFIWRAVMPLQEDETKSFCFDKTTAVEGAINVQVVPEDEFKRPEAPPLE